MLNRIAKKIEAGRRLTERDALELFASDDIHTLGELASGVARRINGNKAFYVRNLHVNPTNLCVNRCRFCAFSRSEGEEGAYELDTNEIVKRIRRAMPVSEVHIVGGLHPAWPFEHYLKLLKRIRRAFPALHTKAFTATEIDYMCRISGLTLDEVLAQLKSAGLDSMPGGGAEIFSEDVRSSLCPEKLSSGGWLAVMESAHLMGIKSNATMLYGHTETHAHRVSHLLRLRDLQDRTAGFQAFIPLSYHPQNTELGGGAMVSGLDDLKTMAVSRLVLDNFRHIKAYWVMLGPKLSQLALMFGADDLDGTVIDERITVAAGGQSGKGITVEALSNLIKKAGRRPVERDSYYRAVKPK